jgi:hypothetical protein
MRHVWGPSLATSGGDAAELSQRDMEFALKV